MKNSKKFWFQVENWGNYGEILGILVQKYQRGEVIFFVPLKLGTRVGHEKLNIAIFEFYDFAKKNRRKIRFKFEKSEKIYKGFPRKKNYMGILCKMNADQNYMEFFCKFFCWRSLINLEGNSFIKYKREIFTKNFLVKKYFHENSS